MLSEENTCEIVYILYTCHIQRNVEEKRNVSVLTRLYAVSPVIATRGWKAWIDQRPGWMATCTMFLSDSSHHRSSKPHGVLRSQVHVAMEGWGLGGT